MLLILICMFAFLVYQTFPAALFETWGVQVWDLVDVGKGGLGAHKVFQLSEVVNAFTHKHQEHQEQQEKQEKQEKQQQEKQYQS